MGPAMIRPEVLEYANAVAELGREVLEKSGKPPHAKPHGGPHPESAHGHAHGAGGQFAEGGGRVPGKGPKVDHALMVERVAGAEVAGRDKQRNPKGNFAYRYEHGEPKSPADRKHLARADAAGKVAMAIDSRPSRHSGPADSVRRHMDEGEPEPPDKPGAVHHVVGGVLVASRYAEGGKHVTVDHLNYERQSDGKYLRTPYEAPHKTPAKADKHRDRLIREYSATQENHQRLLVRDPHSPEFLAEHGDWSPHQETVFRVIHHADEGDGGKSGASVATSTKALDPIGFLWDRARRLYRHLRGERAVEPPAVRVAVDGFGDGAKGKLQALAVRFQSGDINASEFAIEGRKLIKSLHLAAGMVAVGGKAQLTLAILGRIGAAIRSENAYFSAMIREVEAGSQALDGTFLARAAMYGAAATKTYEAVRRAEMIGSGLADEERRVRHSAESCGGCIEEANEGWKPIGTLKAIGSCQCLSLCRCSFEYRMKPADGGD